MKRYTCKASINVIREDMGNILTAAFEGGINHWCTGVECGERPFGCELGEWVSRLITNDFEGLEVDDRFKEVVPVTIHYDGESSVLTTENMISALEKWFDDGIPERFDCIYEGGIDVSNIDAEAADIILQYAIFGELRYS